MEWVCTLGADVFGQGTLGGAPVRAAAAGWCSSYMVTGAGDLCAAGWQPRPLAQLAGDAVPLLAAAWDVVCYAQGARLGAVRGVHEADAPTCTEWPMPAAVTGLACTEHVVVAALADGSAMWCGQPARMLQAEDDARDFIPALPVPRRLDIPVAVAQVACGKLHACLRSTAGEVLMLGHNAHGQLGLCSTEPARSPVFVEALQVRAEKGGEKEEEEGGGGGAGGE